MDVHVLLGSEECHWGAVFGGRRRGCECGRIPLRQEAIRLLIFAPLAVVWISISYSIGEEAASLGRHLTKVLGKLTKKTGPPAEEMVDDDIFVFKARRS